MCVVCYTTAVLWCYADVSLRYQYLEGLHCAKMLHNTFSLSLTTIFCFAGQI
jgi:hypothetical protein